MESKLSKVFLTKLLSIPLSFVVVRYHFILKEEQYHFIRRQSALGRRKRKRVKWAEINERISDTHFCRMFRMTRRCFSLLYRKIIASMGERERERKKKRERERESLSQRST